MNKGTCFRFPEIPNHCLYRKNRQNLSFRARSIVEGRNAMSLRSVTALPGGGQQDNPMRIFLPRNITAHLRACTEPMVQDPTRQQSEVDSSPRNAAASWNLLILLMLPIAILTIATGFFRFTDADLAVSQWAYHSASDPWPGAPSPVRS